MAKRSDLMEVPYFGTLEEMESFFAEAVASPEQPLGVPTEYVYRVDELVDALNAVFRSRIGPISVRGEVSGISRRVSRSGHRYFRLKEGKQAVLDAVLFASAARRISCPLEEGVEVRCRGRLAMYGPQGRVQLVIEEMERLGLGDLMLAYYALKQQLEEEGLFAASRKKALPQFPRRVGVITSPTGAAVRDIMHVLGRRAPSVSVLLVPSLVQGRGAAGQIVRALKLLDQQLDVDVVILGRGGGSIEDLWAFNEESVVRAVAAMEKPVITGVGHETDTTIVDFVADCRAPTPSVAAEIAVLEEDTLREALQEATQRMGQFMRSRLTRERLALERLVGRFPRLEHRVSMLLQRMARLHERVLELGVVQVEQRRLRLHALMQRMDDLSPLQVMQRGFVLVLDEEQRVIRSAEPLQPEQEVDVRFVDGQVRMKVLHKTTKGESWRGGSVHRTPEGSQP